jgi:hypothetical protein
MPVRPRARSFIRWLRASASSAVLLQPVAVHAEDLFRGLGRDGSVSYGGGVFVGYQFGPRAGIEWGLEAYLTKRIGWTECSSRERTGFGPTVQVGIMGTENPRLTLAAHAGGEIVRTMLAVSAEVGLTYRFGSDPGFGIHLGLSPETIFLNAAVRYQVLLNDAWVGGGARYAPTYGAAYFCEAGRPLRTDAGSVALALEPPPSAASARQLAAHAFERDARLEGASVTAFLQLAFELDAIGAPVALIAGALAAARDEIAHTQLCAALAAQGLGQRVDIVLPPITPRRVLAYEQTLTRLAVESWLDGCLAEGSAAKQAAHAGYVTSDLATAQVLRQIAHDEARHGELAWAVLRWCVGQGGVRVRDAVRASCELLPGSEQNETTPSGLARWGRLDQRTQLQLAREHRRACQQRLADERLLA